MHLQTERAAVPPAGQPDIRRAVRHPIDPDECWNINLVAGQEITCATLRNLSTRGMGLIMDERPPLAAQLVAELTNRSGLSSQSLPIAVIHVTPLDEGQWFVGCKFLVPLAHHELLALLDEPYTAKTTLVG